MQRPEALQQIPCRRCGLHRQDISEAKSLNRAVNRNAKRFPGEFVFILEPEEVAALRCQFGTLKPGRGQHRKLISTNSPESGHRWSVLDNEVSASNRFRVFRIFRGALSVLSAFFCGQHSAPERNDLQTKQAIQTALAAFAAKPLGDAATALFESLGYKSQKRIVLKPNTAKTFTENFAKDKPLNPDHALLADWKTVDFLFQLTDEEVHAAAQGNQEFLFKSRGRWNGAEINSFLFLAVTLASAKLTNRFTPSTA
jgi:hypothetical protein